MTKLSVNINKVATIRNARGGNMPDLIQVAKDCERFGAEGITVHPRPDGRHIRYSDVYELKDVVTTEFNIEGYPSEDFIKLVLDVVPAQVTLVPDPPEAITSNAGWNTVENVEFLSAVSKRFKEKNIRVSIFVNPDPVMVKHAVACGADRVELYTESYAKDYSNGREVAIADFEKAAEMAKEIGMGLNAGHDLSLENLEYFTACIPNLEEVSIGHALICDALYYGLENTVQMYLRAIRNGISSRRLS